MIKIGIAIGILSWQTFNMSEVRNVGGAITDNVFSSGSTGYFGYAMYVPPSSLPPCTDSLSSTGPKAVTTTPRSLATTSAAPTLEDSPPLPVSSSLLLSPSSSAHTRRKDHRSSPTWPPPSSTSSSATVLVPSSERGSHCWREGEQGSVIRFVRTGFGSMSLLVFRLGSCNALCRSLSFHPEGLEFVLIALRPHSSSLYLPRPPSSAPPYRKTLTTPSDPIRPTPGDPVPK